VSRLVDGSVKSEIYNKLKQLDVPYKEYWKWVIEF
jgi:hypothetical protein